MGRVAPSYYVQDGVIPRSTLPEVLRRIRDLEKRSGLTIGNVFHAGDGNLHPLVCYDDAVEGQAELAEEVATEILSYCLDAGGSLTGEHGIGADKACHMPKMFDEAGPGDHAAPPPGVRSRRDLQPRQAAADPAALRRGAGAVPRPPGGGGGAGPAAVAASRGERESVRGARTAGPEEREPDNVVGGGVDVDSRQRVVLGAAPGLRASPVEGRRSRKR